MSVICDSCKQTVDKATEINMWNNYLECDLCNAIKTLKEAGYPPEIVAQVEQWQREHPIAGLQSQKYPLSPKRKLRQEWPG